MRKILFLTFMAMSVSCKSSLGGYPILPIGVESFDNSPFALIDQDKRYDSEITNLEALNKENLDEFLLNFSVLSKYALKDAYLKSNLNILSSGFSCDSHKKFWQDFNNELGSRNSVFYRFYNKNVDFFEEIARDQTKKSENGIFIPDIRGYDAFNLNLAQYIESMLDHIGYLLKIRYVDSSVLKDSFHQEGIQNPRLMQWVVLFSMSANLSNKPLDIENFVRMMQCEKIDEM